MDSSDTAQSVKVLVLAASFASSDLPDEGRINALLGLTQFIETGWDSPTAKAAFAQFLAYPLYACLLLRAQADIRRIIPVRRQ